MGTSNFIANFCDGAKRFGKKAWKMTTKVLWFILVIIAIIFGMAYFIISNLVVFALSPVWMPVAFIYNPEWFVKKLEKPMSDELQEALLEGRHLSVAVFGWFWGWLGTTSLVSRRVRYAFLNSHKYGCLKERSIKVQVEFWENTPEENKNTRFHIGLSPRAKIKVLENLLWTGDTERLWMLISNISPDTRGKFVTYLLVALSACDGNNEKQMVSDLLQKADENGFSFSMEMLTETDLWELWSLSTPMKLFILTKMGMKMKFFKRLFDNSLPEGEGAKILSSYVDRMTLGNQYISILLKKAEEDSDLYRVVVKIILKHGLSPDLVQQVLLSKNSEFVGKIKKILNIYADLKMVGGVASINLKEEDQKAENLARWARYCSIHSIDEIAQKRMNFEQYKIFCEKSSTGLTDEALRCLIIDLPEGEYFKFLVEQEFERINANEDLISIISGSPRKYAIFIDEAAKKAEAEHVLRLKLVIVSEEQKSED